MPKGEEQNEAWVIGFAKTAEISIGFVLIPYLLRSLDIFSVPLAYGVGVFIASTVVYWIPPMGRGHFKKWLLISLLIAVFVFLFTSVITWH